MGPDWFTVIAQVINFLILVALLKRFLYGPIVRAMDRREGEIAARLASAADKTLLAEEERKHFAALTQELSETRETLLAKARNEAAEVRRELLEKAREEVALSKAQWQDSLSRERESLLLSLRRHICVEACAIVRRLVSDMADTTLQERMVGCLARRIGSLDEAERVALADEFRNADLDIVVTSSEELQPDVRAVILGLLTTLILSSVTTIDRDSGATALAEDRVRFALDTDLLCGIELRTGGRALAWNLAAYLDGLEQRLLVAAGSDMSPDSVVKQAQCCPESGSKG